MTNVEEAYQFTLRVEEKLNKRFEGRQRGHGQRARGSGRSSGTRRKMKMWVLADTREMRVLTTPVIKYLEIEQEELEDMDKDQEEEASMVPISIAMKKVIMPLNALNDREGQI